MKFTSIDSEIEFHLRRTDEMIGSDLEGDLDSDEGLEIIAEVIVEQCGFRFEGGVHAEFKPITFSREEIVSFLTDNHARAMEMAFRVI